jgi:hypothetical protein
MEDSLMGLVRMGARFPLERTAAGYTPATGAEQALSQVPYVLMTAGDGPFMVGDQPWDTEFGSQLRALPFSNLEGDALRAIVAEYVAQALAYALPQLQVAGCEVTKTRNGAGMRVVQVRLLLRYVETAGEDVSVRNLPETHIEVPY